MASLDLGSSKAVMFKLVENTTRLAYNQTGGAQTPVKIAWPIPPAKVRSIGLSCHN